MHISAEERPFEAYDGDRDYIFVSYAHDDKDLVFPAIEWLHHRGFRIWYDEGITLGQEWEAVIQERLRKAYAFLVFLSPTSQERPWVTKEVDLAVRLRTEAEVQKKDPLLPKILPVVIETIPLGGILSKFQHTFSGLGHWTRNARDGARSWNGLDWLGRLPLPADRTRKSAYEQDVEDLGLARFPTIEDVVKDHAPDERDVADRLARMVVRLSQEKAQRYELRNLFPLTSEVADAAKHLSRRVPEAGFRRERPSNLLNLPVNIQTSFVCPMRLLSGLITRLDQNWPPLMDAFEDLSDRPGSLTDFHLHVEFCWMGWGPSIRTDAAAGSGDATGLVVLQAAYGDEANSLPLLVGRDAWTTCFAPLLQGRAGRTVSLENLLVVEPARDPFFDRLREDPLVRDLFYDRKEPQLALYFPWNEPGTGDGATPGTNGGVREVDSRGAAGFYSTAYAWLILEQVGEDEVSRPPAPGAPLLPTRVVPFFEHPNLANPWGLRFFLRSLVRKSLDHVALCGRREEYSAGFYRLATALFPGETLEIFREEIADLASRDPESHRIVVRRLGLPDDASGMRPHEDVIRYSGRLFEEMKARLRMRMER